MSPSPIKTERDSLVNKIYNGSSKEKKKWPLSFTKCNLKKLLISLYLYYLSSKYHTHLPFINSKQHQFRFIIHDQSLSQDQQQISLSLSYFLYYYFFNFLLGFFNLNLCFCKVFLSYFSIIRSCFIFYFLILT